MLAIAHPDPHVRRRGHLLAIIALVMLGLSALCLPIVVFFGDSPTGLPVVGGSIIVYGATLYLVRQAHAETQARELELQRAALEEAEPRQRDLVATLETPTVVIADGVLLAPIIGIIDSRRAQRVMARLLGDITAQRVRSLIMDISGVSLIDTGVAGALVHTIQAVRLLGCDVTITGISATVATTMTHLGIDLNTVRIARSPQDVLAQYAVLPRG